MSRCTATKDLDVHHKRRDGGNDIDNALVLCRACHVNTSTYGKEGKSPPAFSNETRTAVLNRAGNQCECEKKDCHGANTQKNIKEAINSFKY
ncbi:hypothetical protein FACS1894137_13710 [Spirochaetia bacterium]|nr:hypothetical protein FACS1894137_13710 [Spirochaetia bacterium]